MADHPLSTRVTLSDGGASGYGTVLTPTTAQIANLQAAINAMSVSIDSLLTAPVMVYLVPQSFFESNKWTAAGSKAWGFTPVSGKAFVNNGLTDVQQRYTCLHEIGHTIDSSKGVMNSAKRATVGALMTGGVGAPDQTVKGWWSAGYHAAPNENFADTIPRAYAGFGDTTGGFYTRPIPSGSYATFRSTVGGAGAPASTTLAVAAVAGDTVIHPTSVTGLSGGDWIEFGTLGERHQVNTVGTGGGGGTGVTLVDALTLGYAVGAAVVETGPPSDVSNNAITFPVTATTPSGTSKSYAVTGLAPGSTGTAQIRFFDGTAWSDWSDPVDVALAGTYSATQLSVTPGTLTPDLAASLSGPATGPGAFPVVITAYIAQVVQSTPAGEVVKWNTGRQVVASPSSRRLVLSYSGDPLAWGQTYTFKIALEAGIFSAAGASFVAAAPQATAAFTPLVDVGPLVTYGGVAVDRTFKIDTRTPTFRLAANDGTSNIDQARLRLWADDGTTLLYDSGVVSFTTAAYRDVAVPANVLVWGLDIRIDAAVRIAGGTALGSFSSQKFAAHINAQPGSPGPTSVRHDTAQVVGPSFDPASLYRLLGRTDNVWVASTAQPIAVFPNRDVDLDLGYTDGPTRREIELRNLAGTNVGASPYVITTAITGEWTVPAAVLTAETTYETRARYDDSAGTASRSPFSPYMFLKYSVAPTLTAVTPASGATLTDPTPTFTGTFASASGKAMAAQRLVLSVGGSSVYDSGVVLATTPSLPVPPQTLDTGTTVNFTFYAYDTDGLYAAVTGTVTTAFTLPVAVTGLAVTPDLATDSMLVTYDDSTDPNFSAFLVYVRTQGGQYRLAARTQETALYVRGVSHNTETIIRVTQTNDWGESTPTEASATLGGDYGTDTWIRGYWLVRPELVVDLGAARHGEADTQTDLEIFAPPGRRDPYTGQREKVVLDWGTTGVEATITLTTRDRDLLDLLRTWKEQGLVAILKTWYGAVRYVRLTRTPETDLPAAMISGSISYIEVSPASVDF